MDSKTLNIFNLMKTALVLFRECGYDEASVREIAKASGVSVGMVNHYFGSKEFLGTQCLDVISQYAMRGLKESIDIEEDPILYDLVCVRVLYQYLNRYGYGRFYADSLANDFFFKYLSDTPTRLVRILSRTYPITATEDEIQLYSRYLPYMMEKTLILKKNEGLFSSIDYEEIPLIIVVTALNRFIPEGDILARNAESIRAAESLIAPLEPCVPDDFLMTFVRDYTQRLESTAASQKSNWLRQMNGRA